MDGKFEIRNSKFEISLGWAMKIPNSEFERRPAPLVDTNHRPWSH